MKPRVLHWERRNYHEDGFDLVELYEDGTVMVRTFERDTDAFEHFNETDRKESTIDGTIHIERIPFGKDGTLKKTELAQVAKREESFPVAKWKEARKRIREMQGTCALDQSCDCRSILEVDQDTIDGAPLSSVRKTYPVQFVRAFINVTTIRRNPNPDMDTTIFVPTMNEVLFFHYVPETRHYTITGDGLFPVETGTTDNALDEDGFNDFVAEKAKNIESNHTHYRQLINRQRERRAMIETDEAGDLYPR